MEYISTSMIVQFSPNSFTLYNRWARWYGIHSMRIGKNRERNILGIHLQVPSQSSTLPLLENKLPTFLPSIVFSSISSFSTSDVFCFHSEEFFKQRTVEDEVRIWQLLLIEWKLFPWQLCSLINKIDNFLSWFMWLWLNDKIDDSLINQVEKAW